MPDHEKNRNTIVNDTPAEVESTNRENGSTADAMMQEVQVHHECEDHEATERPIVNRIKQAANKAATETSESFHGSPSTIAYSAGIEVENVSQGGSVTTIDGVNEQNETENELALALSHKAEAGEMRADVLDTNQTSVVDQEESDNLHVNADGAGQKILNTATKPDAISSRLLSDTNNEHPPTTDEDSHEWNSVHLEEEIHRKETCMPSSRSTTATEREICVNVDMPSNDYVGTSLTDDHGFTDPIDSASDLDESLEGELEAIYGLLRDEISNHNPKFHDSVLVDDFHRVKGMTTVLHGTRHTALDSAAVTQTNSENDSINDPSFEAGTGISRVDGNSDQEIHTQPDGRPTVPEQKERNSTSRVSFAAQPSYFSDPISEKGTPKRNSTHNNRNISTSHHKLKSTQRQHSEQHIATRGDEDKRAVERDCGSKHSSQNSSSQRYHSDRDTTRRGDEDEQAAESDHRSKHSSRMSSTDAKRRSSSQRSQHRRSKSRRRRQSRSRRSRHGHRQDRKSDRYSRDCQEDGMVALDEVNLHDSSSSSEEDIAEDQFDDEYGAEARGRGTRKHRSSKKNRMKSGHRSSSLPRVHSEYGRSSSFKPAESFRHDSKRQSYERSLSIGEIETRQGMRSHSSSETRQIQGKRQLQDLESPKRISNKKQKRRREKTRIRNRGFICCGILFCLVSTVGVLSFLLMRGTFKEDLPLAPAEQPPAVLSAPTAEQCRAISQGVRTTSDQTESSARLKQFQIRMEVELDGNKSESEAPFMPILESTLQAVVMPVLAGCEPVTLRRYRRMMGPPLESRRRINERLPHYVISNGSVVDAQFDLLPVALQSRQRFRYPVKILIDLWVQEEVDDGLLANKVRKAFDDFMGSPGIPEDFPLAASTVLRVEPIRAAQDSKEGTAFPTLQPTARPSQTPSLASSTSPSIHDSSGPSFSPSSPPSLRPTAGPSPEPSKTPTLMPSLNPTKYPTRRPTLNPTRSPTAAPVTSSPTRAPVPISQAIDVIIVGAGAAGLSAAYHLHREGVSVVVLEASNAIGGRVKKDSTWDLDLDLGAEWLDYATSDFSDGNDMLSAILDRTVNKQIIREPNLANYWSGSTMRYDPPGSTSTDFRWVDSTWWDFLNEELMSNLPANTVILKSVVKTIDYGYEKPIVFCEDGRTYEGSYVIVTASMKVLQDGMISFVPSLPSRYQEAIDDIKMGSGIKVFLEFTEKFFPDIFSLDPDTETYNFDNCESSSHGVRYFYNPTYAQTSTKHIMGMFAYADIADLYIGQPHDTIIQNLLGLLDQIFNGKASATFVKGVVQDWSSEPYIRAAYTNVAPNGAVDRLRSPIDDKVFFAGESVFSKDSDWGFVQGAALCGEDVAEDIIDAINGR
ncbi:MAG: hypothetical protein SGBAC_011062 [Bacillariaceae sp.]